MNRIALGALGLVHELHVQDGQRAQTLVQMNNTSIYPILIYKLLHCVSLNAGDLHLGNDSRILMKDWCWHYCTEVSRLTKAQSFHEILSINNFTIKLLSKLLRRIHLKGTKKFASKDINRQFFHRKTVFHMKQFSIINFTTKLLSIKDYFLNGPQ